MGWSGMNWGGVDWNGLGGVEKRALCAIREERRDVEQGKNEARERKEERRVLTLFTTLAFHPTQRTVIISFDSSSNFPSTFPPLYLTAQHGRACNSP